MHNGSISRGRSAAISSSTSCAWHGSGADAASEAEREVPPTRTFSTHPARRSATLPQIPANQTRAPGA